MKLHNSSGIIIMSFLQIMPLQKQNLDGLYKDFPNDMKDLVVASDFYDFRPSMQVGTVAQYFFKWSDSYFVAVKNHSLIILMCLITMETQAKTID